MMLVLLFTNVNNAYFISIDAKTNYLEDYVVIFSDLTPKPLQKTVIPIVYQ